jgi:hypothetical protein
MGRRSSTSRIHRDVTQANGQDGSNQKSTLVRFEVDVTVFTVARVVERFISPGGRSVRDGSGAVRDGPKTSGLYVPDCWTYPADAQAME